MIQKLLNDFFLNENWKRTKIITEIFLRTKINPKTSSNKGKKILRVVKKDD